MTANIGFTSLLFIIVLNLAFCATIILREKKGFINFAGSKISSNNFTLYIFAAIFAFTTLAQFSLIYSYVISDYSVLNVYQNSHHLKPLIYKISGSWGNHEGSMLLLITILSIYSFLFAIFDKSEFKTKALVIQSLIIVGITCFTAFASNPFEKIFPAPLTGLDLNPLLQDIGLAMHPPMLYIGYLGFSLVFSLAIAGLLQEKINASLAKSMSIWLFISWGALTLGVILGSWWAYRELGWGGYWFWDPVENVSLMPWIASTALIHCIKILKKDEGFKVWTILLAIVGFILCLFGIFLVRSGLLTSVHSFAVDAKRGFFIIFLILAIGGGALTVFAVKINKILGKTTIGGNNFIFGKSSLILLNNYILITALFTILVGLFYPIISRNVFDSSISVGASYYNKIFTILLLPFLAFLNLVYYKGDNFKQMLATFHGNKQNYFSLLLAIFVTYTVSGDFNKENYSVVFLLFFAINIACITAFRKKSPTNLAHFGFVIALIGIILNSYLGSEKEVNIKINQTINMNEYSYHQVRFDAVNYDSAKNYITRKTDFTILRGGKEYAKLSPELRFYPIADKTTFEADIKHSIHGDFYLAAGNQDDSGNFALRIYFKPYIYLLWLGCLFIVLAAIVKVVRVTRSNSPL